MYHFKITLSFFIVKLFSQASEGICEQEQYQYLMNQINWFFFNLFILGYVEDTCSGASFRLPSDSDWSVYVEVCMTHNYNDMS